MSSNAIGRKPPCRRRKGRTSMGLDIGGALKRAFTIPQAKKAALRQQIDSGIDSIVSHNDPATLDAKVSDWLNHQLPAGVGFVVSAVLGPQIDHILTLAAGNEQAAAVALKSAIHHALGL